MTPFPVIFSAPSGAGKTTIAKRVLETRPDIGYSVSATTRQRRPHEVDGRDYHFLSDAEFTRRRLAGDFAECAEVHGRWYGTLKSEVERVLGSGRHVLMAIDVQGASSFHRAFPSTVMIFVLPPSVETLIARLRARNTESDELIERRLRTAVTEIEAVSEYHYVIVNDDLETAAARASAIIDAEMSRVARQHGVDETVAALIDDLRRGLSANV